MCLIIEHDQSLRDQQKQNQWKEKNIQSVGGINKGTAKAQREKERNIKQNLPLYEDKSYKKSPLPRSVHFHVIHFPLDILVQTLSLSLSLARH